MAKFDDELGRLRVELNQVRAQIIKQSVIEKIAHVELEAIERDAIGICELATEIIVLTRKANGDIDTKLLIEEVRKCLRTKTSID
jgi:hypothetical protein